MLVQLDLNGVAHLLQRQIQPLLFMLVDFAFGRPHQIERLPFRLAHFFENRLTWNAAIHDPDSPGLAVGVFHLLEKAAQSRAV